MNRPVHFEAEILCETTYRAPCGVYSAKHAYTVEEAAVSCPKCLAALGYAVAEAEQLTEVRGDPLRRAA